MQAQTIDRVKVAAATGPAAVAASVGAAALAVATVWFALVEKGVTVSSAPQPAPGASTEDALRGYYRWMVTTLAQERWYTLIAIIGFLGLAAVATVARGLFTGERVLARAGALLVGAGAATWIAAGVGQLGGHRAVGQMATHTNPIETVSSIAFTVDTVADTFLVAAFALIGAGMLGLAVAGLRELPGHRAWAGYTVLVAVVALATAAAFAVDNSDLTDATQFADGIVVLPLWLVWTGRMAARRPAAADTPAEHVLATAG